MTSEPGRPELHADSAASPKPESIRVFRDQGELRIEFDWLPAGWRRAFRIAGAVVALIVVVGVLFGWDARIALPIGSLSVYFCLAYATDRSVITIRDGRLRSVNRPFPWPLGGSVRLADIDEFRIRVRRSGTSGDYTGGQSKHNGDLCARLRSGRKKMLLTDQNSWDFGTKRVRWVKEELQRELASGRWTRSGVS